MCNDKIQRSNGQRGEDCGHEIDAIGDITYGQ